MLFDACYNVEHMLGCLCSARVETRSAPRLTSHHNGKWPVKGRRAGKLRDMMESYWNYMESYGTMHICIYNII